MTSKEVIAPHSLAESSGLLSLNESTPPPASSAILNFDYFLLSSPKIPDSPSLSESLAKSHRFEGRKALGNPHVMAHIISIDEESMKGEPELRHKLGKLADDQHQRRKQWVESEITSRIGDFKSTQVPFYIIEERSSQSRDPKIINLLDRDALSRPHILHNCGTDLATTMTPSPNNFSLSCVSPSRSQKPQTGTRNQQRRNLLRYSSTKEKKKWVLKPGSSDYQIQETTLRDLFSFGKIQERNNQPIDIGRPNGFFQCIISGSNGIHRYRKKPYKKEDLIEYRGVKEFRPNYQTKVDLFFSFLKRNTEGRWRGTGSLHIPPKELVKLDLRLKER
ncbi:hypothetical protein RND71_036983 [Anisodus tanguticus]|uniref:Uncharacterized protein n=1 Tax=Anisodus tanguticus TaxID=243964 RepID=A0AAE1R1H0_9SOLA|nr:hypothetical protein RND71_036983 [Anisodus tanguticus]